jgi:hypothetical protein
MYLTGQKAPRTGRYQFVRYSDGTNSPAPSAEEKVIALTQGETFPPIKSRGKGAYWQAI